MRAISTTGTTVLAAVALLLAPARAAFSAPRDMRRFPNPGAPAYKRPWIGEACKQEFSSFCSSLSNNSRREAIVECLKQHAADLSASCTEAVSDPPAAVERGTTGWRRGGGERNVPKDGDGP